MAKQRKPFEPKPETEPVVDAIAEAESLEEKVVLTVNGKPIPPEFAHAIPYAQTDQGIAEANAAQNGKFARTKVTRDEWDNKLARKAEAEVFDSYDPFKEAVDSVAKPGMSYRMISDRVVNRRGRRGWEPAEDKSGKQIKVGGMTLGYMPTDRAERRNEHYRAIDQERMETAAQSYEENQTKLIRESGKRGLAPLRSGEILRDNHEHQGLSIAAGLTAQRGMGADAAE